MNVRGFVFALALTFSCAAGAEPITWSFTGIVYQGSHVGSTVSGSLTFDPLSLSTIAQGPRYNNGGQYFYPPGNSSLVLGDATDGISSVHIGGGTSLDFAQAVVSMLFMGVDQYFLEVQSKYATGGSAIITLQVYQSTNGLVPSGVFDNADYLNPNVLLDQPVHWLKPGSTNVGTMARYTALDPVSDDFVITSMQVTRPSEPVSEPSSISLVCAAVGLAGIGRRIVRKRQQRNGHGLRYAPTSQGGGGWGT